jgi:hypothetical protein
VPYEPLLEDPAAPHQLVLATVHGGLGVLSCTCLCRGRQRVVPIGTRAAWTTAEALAAWRDWHGQQGAAP